MNAVPDVLHGEFVRDMPTAPERPGDAGTGLPRNAKIYLFALGAVTVAAAGDFYLKAPAMKHHWMTFVALAAAATLAHTFPVKSPRNQMYHTSVVFLVAAALILPPELLVLIPLVQTVPEWLKERYPWPIAGFNISNYTLDALAAWSVAHLVEHHGAHTITNPNARFAVAGILACICFVAVNHVLVAVILKLGRNHTFRETGLFSAEMISIDLVLTILGVSLAAFWNWNPWLIFAALAPLVVVHRSLSVPQLQAEARVDPKTGLYNARYFATTLAAEIARAGRFERPMSLIMADLDLLRDINNSYGHLAGDAVLKGIAEIFRQQLRHYDVPARFGGEEFSILLPETPPEQAIEIAERIRRAVAEREFEVETATEPIRATVSIGVAAYPKDGVDANELIHQADLAVYRAKLQGRNRVLGASTEPLLLAAERGAKLRAVREDGEHVTPLPAAEQFEPAEERRHPRPHQLHGPTFFSLSRRLAVVVGVVSVAGFAAGIAGLIWGSSTDIYGLLAVLALVGGGQALSFELAEVEGTISVSAVGSLAGAALFDYRAALPLAITICVVEWSARRQSLHQVLYNVATLALSSLAAAAIFSLGFGGNMSQLVVAALGVVGGAVYFAVNMALLSLASGVEGHENPWSVFHERFAWLLPHYVVYGFIGAVMGLAYHAVGLYALAVFAVPLLLMRKTQEAYLKHTQRSAMKLREAAETIQSQNVSLEQANRLLRERSTAAMESLSATVDARDSYTAGHSRRVQQLSLAIGRELGLSQAELDLLGHAALFHDIGKLAIPDAILLKPASLTGEEWALMQRHAEEGARIIDRLGFLQDAVPAIRHHHERFDGTGYPDRIAGEEIPLGARIIHVADALDSMLTTRIYRAARPVNEALAEVKNKAGSQFCPRCVSALERILPLESVVGDLPAVAPQRPELVVAS
ncbi:MAG TPA: diguanylate cyclase [Gaiellaceae bacterium]|jgi:diguanylate cyclase (GGDEF)-like protein/putative nucleotidyltransferase with HDIG domain|nr:diguanylate cyclase [Gaiellaceae bacterium]